ncbi:MAG: DUF3574 domain-containing protein [Acetobacteraceae bacterium]
MRIYTLYFGQAVPERADVTEEEWVVFVEKVISPSLPAGFTVLNARGAWFSPRAGRTVHEATKVLVVALPDADSSLATINHVRGAYQTRFRQQLVGMTIHKSCGEF